MLTTRLHFLSLGISCHIIMGIEVVVQSGDCRPPLISLMSLSHQWPGPGFKTAEGDVLLQHQCCCGVSERALNAVGVPQTGPRVGSAKAGERETEAPASSWGTSTSSLCPCLHRTSRTRLLWGRTLSATVVGTPFLLGAHYFLADASERRKLRLAVDGIGRFGR